MGIRNISIAAAGMALIASSSMAADPVRPSAASLSLTPVMGTSLGSQSRVGAIKSRRGSDIAGGAAVIGVLAVAAVAGGVVAATSGGSSNSSVSP